jgi:copper ion binding protein
MSEQTTTIAVSGMNCMGCVQAVTRSIGKLEGIKSVEVTLDPGQAVVTYDASAVTVEALKERVVAAGYGVDGIPASHHH